MKTPVLLITFNRPDHVRRVLSAIRDARPAALYVFRDGPREGNDNDVAKCAEVCAVVKELVDWDCDLHTNYSDVNYGCGAGPMTGISWFFSQVEEGIVMEDDCLPHPDFFGYCEQLLDRYRDNPQVMYISSTLYDDRWQCEASYDFSHYMVTGAWASWARAWKGFDLDLLTLEAKKFRRHCKKLLYSTVEADWWYFKVLEIQRDREKKSYWDFQMQIHLFKNSGLTIHPKVNLVSNIGFDGEGTHTLSNATGMGDRPVFGILPLTHPESMAVDTRRDYVCFAKSHSRGWLKDTVLRVYKRMQYDQGIFHRLLMAYKKLKGGRMEEFIRFVIVGVIATALHYGIYLLLVKAIPIDGTLWTNAAYTIGYVLSWFCNLWLTAHFTFREKVTVGRGVGFAVCHLVNYGLHILFLNIVLRLGVSETWAPIPVYCLVVPINFILVRTVFKRLKL